MCHIIAVNEEDNQEYTYSGTTRRAAKRLQEILDKVAATYVSTNADTFEQNVSTDGSLMLLPGP